LKNRFRKRRLAVLLLILVVGSTRISPAQEAKEHPPLAPPSTLALGMEDMILHFKIFVIADMFQKITASGGRKPHVFFELTDVELDILLKDAMEQSPLLRKTRVLEVFFHHKKLYIHMEDRFFRCYRLEVLPGKFEFKTEPIRPEEFYDHRTLKRKRTETKKPSVVERHS
jgi:hypothetical protein